MKKFKLSEVQANAILDLPLGRLTSLEVSKLEDERASLLDQIKKLETLIKSEKRRRTVVRKECEELIANPMERRTEIVKMSLGKASSAVEPDLPKEDTTFVLSPTGELSCNPEKPGLSATTVVAPFAVAVDEDGFAHQIRGFEEPMKLDEAARCAVPAVSLLPINPTGSIVIVTAEGKIKRIDPQVWRTAPDSASVIKLSGADKVVAAMELADKEDVIVVSSDARVLRTNAGKVPTKGLAALGVAGMKQLDGCKVIGAVKTDEHLSILASNNALSVVSTDEIATKGRGGKGMKLVNLRDEESPLAQIWSHEAGALQVVQGRSKSPKPFPAEVRARGRAMTKNDTPFKQVGTQE